MSKKSPDEYYKMLLNGRESWNRWRFQNPDIHPEFHKCNLSNQNLNGMNLNNASFVGVNLSSSYLSNCNLDESIFNECDISDSTIVRSSCKNVKIFNSNINSLNISYTDFESSNFISCNSKHSEFKNVSFHKADLSGCDFSESIFVNSIFILANLKGMNLIKSNFLKCRFQQAQLNGVGLTCSELKESDLSNTNLSKANLQEVKMIDCNLEEAILTDTILTESVFENCSIYGISAWNLKLKNSQQMGLKITKKNEPSVYVDNIEVAQFIYLLLSNIKIRDVINTVANKAVLILGRFTQTRKLVLDFLRDELRKNGYIPILFDFDKPVTRNFTETITTLAGLSKFIIADLTTPKSVPHEAQAIIPNFKIPFIPLIHESEEPYSMFEDLQNKFDWVLPLVRYRDISDLEINFEKKIIAKAEEKFSELYQVEQVP